MAFNVHWENTVELLAELSSTYLEKTMKRNLMMVGMVVASAFASQAAMADAGMDLAKAKNCLACHAVSTKLVGPAYKDVAAKYAGQKDAEAKLVTKVMKGGSGAWGAIPMPANPQVTDAEAKTLVKWVLAQK
ncbi:cytochrome c-551 [Duganella rhizosphaerae]